MINNSNKNKVYENKLYNKILFLSRNKLLYTDFCLNDTFQNRISLIFLHVSFLFIKINYSSASELSVSASKIQLDDNSKIIFRAPIINSNSNSFIIF